MKKYILQGNLYFSPFLLQHLSLYFVMLFLFCIDIYIAALRFHDTLLKSEAIKYHCTYYTVIILHFN